MRKLFLSGLIIVLINFATTDVSFGASMINFDTDPFGNTIPNGTVISDQYLSLGVLFSGNFYTTNGDFISSPNSVVFYDPDNKFNNPYILNVEFFDPTSGIRSTTDYVEFTATDASHFDTQFQIIGYDAQDNQIGLVQTAVESTGVYDPTEDPAIFLAINGISRVELTGFLTSNGNFVIEGDNFVFNTPNAVPLPATVWLLGSGIACLVGTRIRRKKNRHGNKAGRVISALLLSY